MPDRSLDVKQAPVKSLWEIDVEAGEANEVRSILDFSKKYLIIVQQIIPVDAIGKPAPAAQGRLFKAAAQGRAGVGTEERRKRR